MTTRRVQTALLFVFAGSFVVQVTAFFAVSLSMWPEDLRKILTTLFAVYSIPLAVIIGGLFAQPKKQSKGPVAGFLAWSAILLSIVWNSLFLWRSVSFSVAIRDSPSDVIDFMNSVSMAASFLVAGLLAFFFARKESP